MLLFTGALPAHLTSPAGRHRNGNLTNMNINTWIVLGGVSILLWLVPVEPLSPPQKIRNTSNVSGQIQLVLEQFQTFEQARSFEDISFQRRVNIKSTGLIRRLSVSKSFLNFQFILFNFEYRYRKFFPKW